MMKNGWKCNKNKIKNGIKWDKCLGKCKKFHILSSYTYGLYNTKVSCAYVYILVN